MNTGAENTEIAGDGVDSVAGLPKVKAKKKATKAARITSIDDLIVQVYKSSGTATVAPGDILAVLPVDDEDLERQRALVVEHAREDLTLAAPCKILTFVASRGVDLNRPTAQPGVARVLNRLVELAIVGMCQSRIFRVHEASLVDPLSASQPAPILVREAVQEWFKDGRAEMRDGGKGLGDGPFTAANRARLEKNAVYALGLLRVVQGAWNLDRFIDELNRAVWVTAVPSAIRVERQASTIVESGRLDSLGLVAANYSSRMAQYASEVDRLENVVNASSSREAVLVGQIEVGNERERSLVEESDVLRSEVQRLEAALAAERESRIVSQSHLIDDYELLRTRVIGRLTEEVSLLTTGLEALRDGVPSVTEEYLDRSLRGLGRELEQLRITKGGGAL
ncbi:hypothetical protein ACFQNE_17545 [Gordonia phosphorivorans]|uniref:Uncharacterized protein n=2 Tax=Gordonia TaxID=2053 RepID=A0ABV6HB19_9ACTN